MDQQVAELIVKIGSISGWCVWLGAVCFFYKMSRRETVITRDVTTAQRPAQARKTLLRALAAQPQWRIRERSESVINAVAMRVRLGAVLTDVAEGTQCRIKLDFRHIDRRFVMWMRLVLFVLAPLALLGLPELLRRFVVASAVQAVQWQAVQIVQLVHVLWPLFAIYAAHTQLRGHFIRLLDNLAILLELEA